MTEYILDTSAVRGLSRVDVEAGAKRWHLTISPLSIYEVLCHLDEPSSKHSSTEAAFAYRKEQVLKCRHLELRDDPFAEQAVAVGASASVNQTRFEDRLVVPQIFPLLDAATSLEQFHAMSVTYPGCRGGSLREVAANARHVLDDAQVKYQGFVHRVRDDLVGMYGFKGAQTLDGLDWVRYVNDSARALEREYRNNGAVIDGGAVFSAIFLHVGYVLTRTRLYMSRAGDGQPLHVDPNDMEDAAILLHLDLTEARSFVTGDGSGKKPGTIHAVNEALRRLESASQALGAEVVALPRVISLDEFRAALSSTPQV